MLFVPQKTHRNFDYNSVVQHNISLSLLPEVPMSSSFPAWHRTFWTICQRRPDWRAQIHWHSPLHRQKWDLHRHGQVQDNITYLGQQTAPIAKQKVIYLWQKKKKIQLQQSCFLRDDHIQVVSNILYLMLSLTLPLPATETKRRKELTFVSHHSIRQPSRVFAR